MPGTSPLRSAPAVVVGGGVGPMAGVLLHQAIIRNTRGTRADADHVDVWHIASVAEMPDRTEFLLGQEARNPGFVMAANVKAIGRILQQRGQEWMVAVPCATFHAARVFDAFKAEIEGAPGYLGTIHLVEATVSHILSLPGSLRKVGVLSTEGSHRMGVWREPLEAAGLEIVEIGVEEIGKVHAAIYDPGYGLKAVQPPTRAAEDAVLLASRRLLDRGAQVLVLGCTELPFVAESVTDQLGDEMVVCDPLLIQARRVVSAVRRQPAESEFITGMIE